MKKDIKSMQLRELKDYFESAGERAFRAGQVFSWLHSGVRTFGEMTNIPAKQRELLNREFSITVPVLAEKQVSGLDGTIKYLWRIDGGDTIESVLMEYEHGNTVCISSQVGCRMGCAFCASTIAGFARNLSASEMLDQVLFTQLDSGKRISNVVLMGIGEPLDNFDNMICFINLITHPSGMNIGARHITVSTCGIVENIDRLAGYDVQCSLAISLHAPDDETRTSLVPANRGIGVSGLIEAGNRYFKATGRRVSYEYAMIAGVNDSKQQASLLGKMIKKAGSHLNLILLSDVPERPFLASSAGSVKTFTGVLRQEGVNFTIRRSLGSDIEASCGQLRRRLQLNGV